MLLKLTRHVQKRIKERGIDLKNLRKAVEKPDTQSKLANDKVKAIRKIGKKKIVVIYKKDGFSFKDAKEKVYIIITAYNL